jgi:hypothetical protein
MLCWPFCSASGVNQREAREKLLGLPIDIIPADQTLAEIAGEIKATKRR